RTGDCIEPAILDHIEPILESDGFGWPVRQNLLPESFDSLLELSVLAYLKIVPNRGFGLSSQFKLRLQIRQPQSTIEAEGASLIARLRRFFQVSKIDGIGALRGMTGSDEVDQS